MGYAGCWQGRYSFVGAQPAMEVVARGHSVTVIDHTNQNRSTRTEEDPMEVAVRLSTDWQPALTEGLPTVFTGGWVGYCGYDTVRYVYSGAIMLPLATPCISRVTRLPLDQAPVSTESCGLAQLSDVLTWIAKEKC